MCIKVCRVFILQFEYTHQTHTHTRTHFKTLILIICFPASFFSRLSFFEIGIPPFFGVRIYHQFQEKVKTNEKTIFFFWIQTQQRYANVVFLLYILFQSYHARLCTFFKYECVTLFHFSLFIRIFYFYHLLYKKRQSRSHFFYAQDRK